MATHLSRQVHRGTHGTGDRTSPLDDCRRRPNTGARGRPCRRVRHARRAPLAPKIALRAHVAPPDHQRSQPAHRTLCF